MAAATATSQIGEKIDQPKNKSSKIAKQASKDPKRCNWKENCANPLLSGIEFRDANSDELVHFITIQHKEIHKESSPFRVTVPVNEDGTFTMPRKQTFDEMIQAKRRQQNASFASAHHTTTSSVLSDRAARRVSVAARRQSSALNTSANSRSMTRNSDGPSTSLISSRSSKSSRRPRPKKKKPSRSAASRKSTKPSKNSDVSSDHPEVATQTSQPPLTASTSTSSLLSSSSSSSTSWSSSNSTLSTSSSTTTIAMPAMPAAPTPKPTTTTATTMPTTAATISASTIIPVATTSATGVPTTNLSISKPFEVKTSGDDLAIVTNNRPVHMISSMKELSRQNPSLGSMDKKEIKRLLKSAPPGAALVLSNGTVIKKSRRGGARAGAGRKRSRPLPNGTQASGSMVGAQQQDSRSSLTNMSTSSEQTVLTNSANTSEPNTATPNP